MKFTVAGFQLEVRWPLKFHGRLPRRWRCQACLCRWRFDQCPFGLCPQCGVVVRREVPGAPTRPPKTSADSGRSATPGHQSPARTPTTPPDPSYLVPMECGFRLGAFRCDLKAGHDPITGHRDPTYGYWDHLG